jgi:hypothetical protein
MVRIVRLALEEGVSFPSDLYEVEWPDVALQKQREKQKGMGVPAGEPAPKRRRGRPRKITPQTEWPVAENSAPPSPTRQSPAETDSGKG